MKEELKPCPFCGKQVEYVNLSERMRSYGGMHTNGPDTWVFSCTECQYELQFSTNSQHKHVSGWNTRTLPGEADND